MRISPHSTIEKTTAPTASVLGKRECLVLIICGLFTLLCLGAVGAAGRRRAKQAVCLSNLRQWGRIFQAYTNDNDGYFFAGDPGTPGYWWVRRLEERYKDYKRNKFWFCPTAAPPIIDDTGALARSTNVFSAWGIYKGPRMGPNGMAGSYGLNGYVLNIKPGINFEGGVPAENAWRTPNVTGGRNIPLFADSLRWSAWPLETNPPAQYWDSAWSGNSMARLCINRHEGAINMIFLDWSARKVPLKQLWTLKWHRSFNTEGPWTTAGGVQPTDWPEWMRDFKDY